MIDHTPGPCFLQETPACFTGGLETRNSPPPNANSATPRDASEVTGRCPVHPKNARVGRGGRAYA